MSRFQPAKALIFFLSLLFSLGTSFAAPETNKLPYTSDSKPIMVAKETPEFTIRLKSNPTTGFKWFISDYNASFVSVQSEKYEKGGANRIGASGTSIWTFRVMPGAMTASHTFKITMTYAQPWSSEGKLTKTFTVFTTA